MVQRAQTKKPKHLPKHPDPPTPRRVIKTPDRTTAHQLLTHPASPSIEDLLALQRTVGNRAATCFVQAKMRVGPADDRYEREADRVARQVLMSNPPDRARLQRQEGEEEEIQTKPLDSTITPLLQRQEDEEELQTAPLQRQEEEEELQLKPTVQRRGWKRKSCN